jgi:hypothetical protein
VQMRRKLLESGRELEVEGSNLVRYCGNFLVWNCGSQECDWLLEL